MKLIDGRVEGGAVVLDGCSRHAAPVVADKGAIVTFNVRPEHLDVASDGIPAWVSAIEPTDSETVVLAVPEGGGKIVGVFYEWLDLRIERAIYLICNRVARTYPASRTICAPRRSRRARRLD